MRRFEWVPGIDASGLSLPQRQTAGAAGYDLFACEAVVVDPGDIALVPTGVRALLANGEFLAVFSRSSLALRHRLMLANGVGVVDRDYYDNAANGGHIFVPLWNFGGNPVKIERGERIAQGIFLPHLFAANDGAGFSAPPSEARRGGFGSTGITS